MSENRVSCFVWWQTFWPLIECNATTFAMSVCRWIFPECRDSYREINKNNPPTLKMSLPKPIENVWMQPNGGPRDTDKRPSRPGWRERTRWGRRCVRTSLSLRCGCATARAATLPSGSLRNSRRSWCSPSRPDTRSRTPRRAPACAWRCSSEWPWPSAGGCLLWGSAFSGQKKRTPG